jgi:hypothetical protein
MNFYLFLVFCSYNVTCFMTIWKFSRFLTILTVPVALMVAAVTLFILSTSPRWVRLTTFMLVSTHILLATVFPIYNRQVTQVVLYYEAPYKVTFARLNSYDDVGTLHIEHGRWALRGTFYNNLVGRAYQYEIMKDQTANNIASGDIVIYDPLFFTPYAENRLAIEDYPALQTLPEQPPDNWELLFTAERLPQPDYPVYVYRVK